jgi:hypothetical protein
MEPAFASRLQHADKEQLVWLLQELAARHPVLLNEMFELLEQDTQEETDKDQTDEEVTEDWDFSGNEIATAHTPPNTFDNTTYQQRLNAYPAGTEQETSADDLNTLLDEAQMSVEQHDYQNAIALYALVLDERLAETGDARAQLFDSAIDAHLSDLETLLSEASSNILLDAQSTFSPLLTIDMRRAWLKRLFTLWLKRLDARRQEEHISEIILNVAWSNDLSLLYQLVLEELQQQPVSTHSNIVDLQHQYRTRTLEKFLKELPRP